MQMNMFYKSNKSASFLLSVLVSVIFPRKQGRIHGRRCVRLCYLVNSGRAIVFVCMCMCVCVCERARVCVCFTIPRHCGSANSLISAARLCVCMCVYVHVCVCQCLSVHSCVSDPLCIHRSSRK